MFFLVTAKKCHCIHVYDHCILYTLFLCFCFFFLKIFADAAYRFYRLWCEEESAKCRGKLRKKNKNKWKHECVARVSYVTINLILCWFLWPSVWYVGLCGHVDCQSDNYVGLCGHVTVSLICWALWSCDCHVELCGHVTVSLKIMLGLVAVRPSVCSVAMWLYQCDNNCAFYMHVQLGSCST